MTETVENNGIITKIVDKIGDKIFPNNNVLENKENKEEEVENKEEIIEKKESISPDYRNY